MVSSSLGTGATVSRLTHGSLVKNLEEDGIYVCDIGRSVVPLLSTASAANRILSPEGYPGVRNRLPRPKLYSAKRHREVDA